MEYFLTKDELYHSSIQSQKYGVPEQKKFPLFDLDHVKSAIKFFNYVDPKYEDQLAKAILRRAKEYGLDLSEMSIGDNNRFKKYLPNDELKHHGILGQKWGVRRYQNPDGTLTKAGKKRKNRALKSEKYREKETAQAKKILEKKLRGNYAVADMLFDAVKNHTKSDGQIVKGSEGLKYALDDVMNDLEKNLKISELVNNNSLKAGHDYIVNAEENDLIMLTDIDKMINNKQQ